MTDGAAIKEKVSKITEHQALVEIEKKRLGGRHPDVDPNMLTQYARDRIADRLRRERLQRELDQAKKDPLTGLASRSVFDERLQDEVMRSRRSGQPLVIVILDANKLKEINDQKGHEAGDEYLKRIAKVLQATSRASDVTARETEEEGKTQQAARWGGDEFGVILFDTNTERANIWWRRVAKEFEKEQISIAAGMDEITVQELQRPDFNANELIKTKRSNADEAMYAAKGLSRETGRNEIFSYKQAGARGLLQKNK